MRRRIPALALFLGTNLLFSSTALIKSTDGGRTWLAIDPGLSDHGIVDHQISRDGRPNLLEPLQDHVRIVPKQSELVLEISEQHADGRLFERRLALERR
jgi:hypothetical protein